MSLQTNLLVGFDLTYEELKQRQFESDSERIKSRFDLTYEELKQRQRPLIVESVVGFDLTYEELKQFHSNFQISIFVSVLILPMRN